MNIPPGCHYSTAKQHNIAQPTTKPIKRAFENHLSLSLSKSYACSFKIICILFQNLKSIFEIATLAKSSSNHKAKHITCSHALNGRTRQPTMSECLNCILNARHSKYQSQPNTMPQWPNKQRLIGVQQIKPILRHYSAKHTIHPRPKANEQSLGKQGLLQIGASFSKSGQSNTVAPH